jgi:hypothetical protein
MPAPSSRGLSRRGSLPQRVPNGGKLRPSFLHFPTFPILIVLSLNTHDVWTSPVTGIYRIRGERLYAGPKLPRHSAMACCIKRILPKKPPLKRQDCTGILDLITFCVQHDMAMEVPPKEGLQVTRLIMVISSMAPLFVLWALRGSPMVNDAYFLPLCTAFAVLPTLWLCRRVQIAKGNNEVKVILVGQADDHRNHILVYLFALLLPFYTVNLGGAREFAATVLALAFVIFLFWHLNMHYMNLVFAMRGYRVFTITPPGSNGNPYAGRHASVLLTKRAVISPGESIDAFRLSDSVFIEM